MHPIKQKISKIMLGTCILAAVGLSPAFAQYYYYDDGYAADGSSITQIKLDKGLSQFAALVYSPAGEANVVYFRVVSDGTIYLSTDGYNWDAEANVNDGSDTARVTHELLQVVYSRYGHRSRL